MSSPTYDLLRKHYRNISRRVSQSSPTKSSSDKKLSSKQTLVEPASETVTVEVVEMTQKEDSKSPNSPLTRKNTQENVSFDPLSTEHKNENGNANPPTTEPQESRKSQKSQKSKKSHKETVSRTRSNDSMTPPSNMNMTLASQLSTTLSLPTKSNKNGPDEKYQLNSHLLFEHSFPGHTYVSVHLQRLQHGIYSDANLHTKHTLHVTFVALSFVFHPSTPSHRFESSVIEIKVKDTKGNGYLRMLKFAPHQAYGKISTESLKWCFQLGASLGVTQGPANVSVKPSVSEEKSKVVGAMMKM